MAFFTRTMPSLPLPPGEDEEEIYSEDDWDEELEERRTPDGRSSKTSYEVRRSQRSTNMKLETAQSDSQENIDKNVSPKVNNDESVNKVESEDFHGDGVKSSEEFNQEYKGENVKQVKTDEDRYEFIVDRVLGVQV